MLENKAKKFLSDKSYTDKGKINGIDYSQKCVLLSDAEKAVDIVYIEYSEAVDRNDLLEKYVEELSDIILQFPTLPAEYLLLAKDYRNRLYRVSGS